MYSYFKGNIISVNSSSIVIDVNNIGFDIIVPNPFSYQEGNVELVYTHLHVREDNMSLYGFKNENDKVFFRKLLSVKGIGPKSALAILASGNVEEISSVIAVGDDASLTKYPGIGPKAAKQIILDLKGKLDVSKYKVDNEYDDVVEALIALGYKKKDIEKLVNKLEKGLNDSQAIKLVLKQL
ncbi:MAG: Holliday junction branch migration protein RuvA [Bacilli bacterium]